MTTTTQGHPFYQKFAYILIILIALGFLYYVGQQVISPLLLAFLFAILLHPLAQFMTKRLHMHNTVVCLLTVALFMFFFLAIFYFISTQIAEMADDWDKIKSNLHAHYDHLQSYIGDKLNLSKSEQKKVMKDVSKGSIGDGKQLVSNTLSTFTDMVTSLILVPIYMFLLLLYRTHFLKFTYKLFDKKHHEKLNDIIQSIKISVKGYIMGLLFEMIIVSALTSLGLFIIGIKYFLLLGVITGLLNLIPYLGILIAGFLTVIASLTGSGELSTILGIVIVNVIVQFIDNNILVPTIVISKVEINSFATIVGIVIGGLLGGISGMFLAIPIMSMLKVIFDRIDALEPWGYLLGDDLPKPSKRIKMNRFIKPPQSNQ